LRKRHYFNAESAEIRRGPLRKQTPINLTVIYAMADNNGLFLGVPGTSPLLNQFVCPWLPIRTLAAEVFVA
jgi:hypothetical protein